MIAVLVLGGGPDAERAVSLESARAVAEALRASGGYEVEHRQIERVGPEELSAWAWDVAFPVLHGPWGEGGPLQDVLEAVGRPYVGSGPVAARLAMDKMATKLAAAGAGVLTPPACVLRRDDPSPPLPFPFVLKPVHEGSSVGLHVVRCERCWAQALAAVCQDMARHAGRVYIAERFVPGRELTVGVLDGQPLPVVEIIPAEGIYDYQAKYARDDTRYVVAPPLPPHVSERLQRDAVALAQALGVRHIARADFRLDAQGQPWLLEINTMPGFTAHSLVPMAARHVGLDMPALCRRLVQCAWRDGGTRSAAPSQSQDTPAASARDRTAKDRYSACGSGP